MGTLYGPVYTKRCRKEHEILWKPHDARTVLCKAIKWYEFAIRTN